jgi:hypothetical protein
MAVDPNAVFQFAQQTAAQWNDQAVNFVATLTDLAASEFVPQLADARLPVVFNSFAADMRARVDVRPGKPSGMAFQAPGAPPNLAVSGIREAVNVAIPDFTEAAPQLNLPAQPGFAIPPKPAAPDVQTVSVPAAPDIQLPEAPTVKVIAFPDAPSVQLPTLSATPPEEPDLLLQTTEFEWVEPPLGVPLLDRAGEITLDEMNEGGHGIHPNDEESLWERARDRELRQAQAQEEDAFGAFSSLGHSLPTGALARRIDELRRDAQGRISDANREISVVRADLFRQARQAALERAVNIDSVRLTQHGFRMERALNAARFGAEFGIAVFDAQARVFNIRVQAFDTFVRAYNAQLQGELAKVEIFRTQVQAAAEQQRAEMIQVELYSAIVNAARTRVQIFESQVRAASLEMDVERLKTEVFRSQIEAFVAEIRGNAIALDAYQAAVRGELAKLEVFQTQVGAFSARVQAAGIESDVRNRNVSVDIARRQSEIAQFQAEVQRFQAQLAGETARVEALLREYGADTEVYSAAMRAWTGLTSVTLGEVENLSRKFEQEVAFEQSNARLQLEAVVEAARRRFDAANAGSSVVQAFSEMAGQSAGFLLAQIEESGAS